LLISVLEGILWQITIVATVSVFLHRSNVLRYVITIIGIFKDDLDNKGFVFVIFITFEIYPAVCCQFD